MGMISALGRYQIASELGKGAMGVIYKAVDPLIDRTVALKTIRLSDDLEEMREYEGRFFQEAKAAGRLNHPNIVTIYDVGNSDGIAYIAMEFLEGRNLKDVLCSGEPLPWSGAVDIAIQMGEGLEYAHQQGVVHRDIKPANVMIVRDGQVKITDFGIAKMRSAEVKTSTGVVLGSPRYMSPEQVMGKRVDNRSDIFSLGVVLYEMLTGTPPFIGSAGIHALMYQITRINPKPLKVLKPDLPSMLDFIMNKALAKDLEQRYQDVKAFVNDLQECARQAQPEGINLLQKFTTPLPAAVTGDSAHPDNAEIIDDSEPAESGPSGFMISKLFNSADATMHLAALTGVAEEFDEYASSQGLLLPVGAPAINPKTDGSRPPPETKPPG
ncbi:MAG: serine/threonine protein kinase [Burkholderiales bacterium]